MQDYINLAIHIFGPLPYALDIHTSSVWSFQHTVISIIAGCFEVSDRMNMSSKRDFDKIL